MKHAIAMDNGTTEEADQGEDYTLSSGAGLRPEPNVEIAALF